MSLLMSQFEPSPAPLKEVKWIQLGVLSPEEIKRMSVVHVTKPVGYTPQGEPIRGGLDDPELGDTDTRGENGRVNDHPGYFGHVETGQLKIDKDSAAFRRAMSLSKGSKRLHELMLLCRGKKDWKGVTQPKLRLDRYTLSIQMEYDQGDAGALDGLGDRKQTLTPRRAREILRNISQEDCRCLGLDPRYSRPEWMVLTVLPIGPPHIRPSVAVDGGARSADDLTHVYGNVIKANTKLESAIRAGVSQPEREELERALQYYVGVVCENPLPGFPMAKQRTGRPLKTIRERLVGKAGRVRGNLMGKRVDFSARSVITGDPIISIHQVGVPRSIARNLTVPVTVTRYNLGELQQLVANGPEEHPGAKYIIREDGSRVDLQYVTSTAELRLKPGWIVERHLYDDDVVLFNRQPSLHKMSIMCHRVKVLDYSTFRLNLVCTTPYNADFDGDEMNMHALQTLPAIAEAATMMAVPQLIVSSQNNRPVMGVIQDTLLGASFFTRRDCFLERDMVMHLLMWMYTWNGRIPKPAIMVPNKAAPGQYKALWTGKQIISLMMPDIHLEKKSSKASKATLLDLYPDDRRVIVDRGELLAGILDKGLLGTKSSSIVHIICNDAGAAAARDFLNQIQRCVNAWLTNRGFTVGEADMEGKPETMRKIADEIEAAKQKVRDLVVRAYEGQLKQMPGKSMYESFEHVVNTALGGARDVTGKLVEASYNEMNNSIVAMMLAGSKGSINNIAQIVSCVGQQNVVGQRVRFGFYDRTLPHFQKSDQGAASRGFVENSYLKGLTPYEFFFHMMSGREGLIDTAVKTASTGYIQRKLVKSMEDLTVRYDGTVRNSMNEVVQFLYGEDGMDGRWIEEQAFATYNLTAEELRKKFSWDLDDDKLGEASAGGDQIVKYMTDEAVQTIRTDPSVQRLIDEEFEVLQEDREVIAGALIQANKISKNALNLPVNLARLIRTHIRGSSIDTVRGVSDLRPDYVIVLVQELCDRLVVVRGEDQISREANTNATRLFKCLLRSELASKRVIRTHRMTEVVLRNVIGDIENKFSRSYAPPGDMCGVLAAQSIGEPTTQMTLNTFHNAGIATKNVTLGVPRLTELMSIAKNIKTPQLTIYVKEHLWKDEEAYSKLQVKLEYTRLSKLVKETRVYYDPDAKTSMIAQDRDWVEASALLEEGEINYASLGPWVLRMELGRAQLDRAKIGLEDIKQRIIDSLGSDVHVVYNSDQAEKPVIRLRVVTDTARGSNAVDDDDGDMGPEADDETYMKEVEDTLLHQLKLRGVRNIEKLYHKTEDRHGWNRNDGLIKICEKEPVFETDGTNLLDVLRDPDVDATRTHTNHVVEILEVLGIEACRAQLFRELTGVISFDGAYVNYRHLSLLVDNMTFRGYLCAVSRHGINRVDNGPFQRASFEETVEILMEAAAHSEVDLMGGVSENIMMGQMAPVGTGHFYLVLDESKLKHAVATVDEMEKGVDMLGGMGEGGATPMLGGTPDAMTADQMTAAGAMTGAQFSPAEFSPDAQSAQGMSPSLSPNSGMSPGAYSPDVGGATPGVGMGGASPAYGGASPGHGGSSPAYGGSTPAYGGSTPAYGGTSSVAFGGTATIGAGQGKSPVYSPTSPYVGAGTASAGVGGGASPAYSPTSPYVGGGTYAGTASAGVGGGASPAYSPTSPYVGAGTASAGVGGGASPAYSPTSPYVGAGTASAGVGGGASPAYSPTSPYVGAGAASAGVGGGTSPAYSPTSPYVGGGAGMASAGAAGTSPAYSPTSPYVGGGAGSYGGGAGAGTSPAYSPTSPYVGGAGAGHASSGQVGASPAYSPTSPYVGGGAAASSSGAGAGASPAYSPTSPYVGAGSAPTSASSGNAYSPTAGVDAGTSGAGQYYYSPLSASPTGGTGAAGAGSSYSPVDGTSGAGATSAGAGAYSPVDGTAAGTGTVGAGAYSPVDGTTGGQGGTAGAGAYSPVDGTSGGQGGTAGAGAYSPVDGSSGGQQGGTSGAGAYSPTGQ